VVVGLLAILAVPAGVAASRVLEDVRLVEALEIAVAVGFVLALLAIVLARRARINLERRVFPSGGRTVRTGRVLAWTAMYIVVTAALALAFYGALRWGE
jgi:ABC-type iron transport system FetAB permease component